jgi:dCTP deaminase
VLLSDTQIKTALASGSIKIEPYIDANVQPSSLDIRLGATVNVLGDSNLVDLGSEEDLSPRFREVDIGPTGYVLEPGKSIYGSAMERISFGSHAGIVFTRSSLGRIGLICNVSGYANPGYDGHLPLVIANLGNNPVRLGEEGPTTRRHHLDPELKDLLRKMGVPSRHLEKTADFLDRRIDEVAASTTQPPKRDR